MSFEFLWYPLWVAVGALNNSRQKSLLRPEICSVIFFIECYQIWPEINRPWGMVHKSNSKSLNPPLSPFQNTNPGLAIQICVLLKEMIVLAIKTFVLWKDNTLQKLWFIERNCPGETIPGLGACPTQSQLLLRRFPRQSLNPPPRRHCKMA